MCGPDPHPTPALAKAEDTTVKLASLLMSRARQWPGRTTCRVSYPLLLQGHLWGESGCNF